MNLLKGSHFLKFFALVAAIVTYFLIHQEIQSLEQDKKISDPSYKLIKLTAANLPVKVRLASPAAEGHRIVDDQVSSSPAKVTVIGPEALLQEASSAETALVDVSEVTKTVVRKIPLESVAGIHLSGEPLMVEVTVPIEKIESDSKEAKKG